MKVSCKHLAIIIVSSLLSFFANAQWVSIPDTNFGTWLNTNGYTQCMQGNNSVGWQMDTTCPAIFNETIINCGSSNISDISGVQFFKNLEMMTCSQNNLDSLPQLPDLLRYFDCSGNNLEHLPKLPITLMNLHCFDNMLKILPALPNSLSLLYCWRNQLTTLPNLPKSLGYLSCYQNLLTSLPVLDSLMILECSDNPYLNCLPQLKYVHIFNFRNTGITCIPNYHLAVGGSDPPLNTFPLCDLINPNDCDVYWKIGGKVYTDTIENCQHDPIENLTSNINMRLYQNGELEEQVNTNAFGQFSFATDTGSFEYTIDTSDIPLSIFCPDFGYYTSNITVLDSLAADMNFGLRCKSGHDVGVQSINGRFRPADLRLVEIHAGDMSNFYGANCATGVSGTLSIVMNGEARFISSAQGALTPSSINGDTLNYTIADFGNINFNTAFNIMVLTDTTAPLGSEVCFQVSVTPLAGDNNPTNNTLTQCFTVVGSYDPNDKSVYPSTNIDTTVEWLTYTIRFQNTGADTARHVFITDTLSNALDVENFRLLSYSHQPNVQIKGNALRFNFPYINLVDSPTNEPLSNGYVQYKIKLKPNQPIGTSINNTAFIYFDFNDPIVTNTTTNTIALLTSIASPSREELKFSLYPNPAKSTVNLFASKEFIGQQVIVVDLMGRVMFETTLNTPNISINASNLSAGVYIVRLGNSAARLVIEK